MSEKTLTAQPGASTYQKLLAELKQHVTALQTLREQTIETLTPTVQELVRSGSDGEFVTMKSHSAVDRDVSGLSPHPTPF